MRAIAAKLLEAKMDQLRQVVIIGYVSHLCSNVLHLLFYRKHESGRICYLKMDYVFANLRPHQPVCESSTTFCAFVCRSVTVVGLIME